MKIAFLINSPFRLGGAQRVTSVISNLLYEKGYDVSIISSKPVKVEDRELYKLDNNIKLVNLKYRNLFYKLINVPCKIIRLINTNTNVLKHFTKLLEFAYYKHDNYIQKQLIEIINQEKYDYVIGVEGIDFIPLASIKNKINSKIIAWQHSSFEAYFKTKGYFYYNQDKIMKKYLPYFDKYIVLTNVDRSKVDNEFKINSVTIGNPKSFESNIKSDLSSKTFLAAGRFVSLKGFDMLIDAFKIFSEDNKDWNLNIVGEGNEYNNLNEKIIKYNLQDRVFLKEYTKKIEDYMINSSVYLMSSRLEGFGMVVLESMEFGLPIISFDIPCSYELIEEDKNGIIVKSFDINMYAKAMSDIIKDSQRLKEMGQYSIKKADEYLPNIIVSKWINIFR